MDFAKILDEWEKRPKQMPPSKSSKAAEKEYFENWMDSDRFWESYDKGDDYRANDTVGLREQLKNIEPEAELDLHGHTTEEAFRMLDLFFSDAVKQGLRKVLIIHGKGHHSKDSPVLPGFVRNYLERSRYAGQFGQAKRNRGGSGATWVIVRSGGKGDS